MGTKRPRPVVLDTGALIAFERNVPKVRLLLELAIESGTRIYAPAAVIAQAWRDGAKQTRLSRLVGSGWLLVQPLDLEEAKASGSICGRSNTADIVDASVVLLARHHGGIVVTSDPSDIVKLDRALQVETC